MLGMTEPVYICIYQGNISDELAVFCRLRLVPLVFSNNCHDSLDRQNGTRFFPKRRVISETVVIIICLCYWCQI